MRNGLRLGILETSGAAGNCRFERQLCFVRSILPIGLFAVIGSSPLCFCLFGCALISSPPLFERASQGMEAARRAYELEEYARADELLEEMQDRYPGVNVEEVLFLRGRSNYELGELLDAFSYYERLIEQFFNTTYATQVQDDLYEMGVYYIEGHGRWLGIFPRRGRGLQMLEHIITHFARSPKAEEAQRRIAQYFFDDGEWADARAEYAELRDRFPTSTWKAVYDFRHALCWRLDCKGLHYDRKCLESALVFFDDFIEQWEQRGNTQIPEAKEHRAELRELLGYKEYAIGDFYEDLDRPFGARIHYENAIRRYPETRGASLAQEAVAELQSLGESIEDE